ncbi:MAG: tetratricopeptide repeat protein [Thermoguttaceae bacterium]
MHIRGHMSETPSLRDNLAKASSLIRSGHPNEAIPILDRIVEVDPACSFARAERGRAKLFSGDHQGAMADFTEMIHKWPTEPEGFTCRAHARELVGDLQGAIEDYSSAISVDPIHPFAFLQRGRVKVLTGDLSGALPDFTADMENSDNGRLSGLLNRGRTKYLLGDLSGAIMDLTEAIPLERAGPVFAPLFRGRAKLAAGDYGGAISDFTAAIDAFPWLVNAYRHRAEARALAGDKNGANEDLMRYNELGGRDLPAYA